MNKELLKKCRAAIEVHCVTFDHEAKALLLKEIDEDVEKPEPEPAAYILKGHTMTGDIADYLSWTKLGMGVVTKLDSYDPVPLYTSPPARKPLSESDLIELFIAVDPLKKRLPPGWIYMCRAIEKAHGIE